MATPLTRYIITKIIGQGFDQWNRPDTWSKELGKIRLVLDSNETFRQYYCYSGYKLWKIQGDLYRDSRFGVYARDQLDKTYSHDNLHLQTICMKAVLTQQPNLCLRIVSWLDTYLGKTCTREWLERHGGWVSNNCFK